MVLGMSCFRLRALSAIAQAIVMDISLMKVIEITDRRTKQKRKGAVKRNDIGDPKFNIVLSCLCCAKLCH